jgi:hypothetical protein
VKDDLFIADAQLVPWERRLIAKIARAIRGRRGVYWRVYDDHGRPDVLMRLSWPRGDPRAIPRAAWDDGPRHGGIERKGLRRGA